MGSHVLAVDLGTTGLKVAIVDADGRVRASASEPLELRFSTDGGVEQDPNEWWAALGRCARRAVADSNLAAGQVRLVAVTSQYTSTVAIDAIGRPLAGAIMWMDRRGSRHHPLRGRADLAAEWLDRHGLAPGGNDDIGHVAFLRAERPSVYADAAAFVEPMDALVARLTGRITATQHTMFPMMCLDNRHWGATTYDESMVELAGYDPAKLPSLVGLGEPRGALTPEAAGHLGISDAAIVAGATVDSVTSAIGTGAVSAERTGLVIGTTAVLATHLPDKRLDVAHGMTSAPSPIPGTWFLVAENGIGGKALDTFVHQVVYPDDGLGQPAPPDAVERVLAVAATVPPGANGVIHQPWLVGSMAPTWDRRVRAGFLGIGLSTTRADLARAVLEGVAANVAWLLPDFVALSGASERALTFGGGGARSALWGQIIADTIGAPVRRLAGSTTTNAHGAALLALAEHGGYRIDELPGLLRFAQTHEPDPAVHRVLAPRIAALIEIHDRLASIYSYGTHVVGEINAAF